MILSHRVALDFVQLDSLDDRIMVKGIEEGAARETISAVPTFGAAGQRITGRHRDTLEVKVKFGINVHKKEMQARQEIFDKVCAWAMNGGLLQVGHRPGQSLRVVCAQLPAEGDPWAWTAVYEIVFRAYEVPYWEDDEPTEVEGVLNLSDQIFTLGTLNNPGPDAVCDVTVSNRWIGACQRVQIWVGETHMDLHNVGLEPGQDLKIEHAGKILRMGIYQGNTFVRTVLDCRTPDSSDELVAKNGSSTVLGSVSGVCSMQVMFRRRHV